MIFEQILISENAPDEILDNFNNDMKILILAGVCRTMDLFAPWFDKELHDLSQVVINVTMPNIEVNILEKNTNSNILKLISSEWLVEEIKKNHQDLYDDMVSVREIFLEEAKEWILNQEVDA